MSAEKVNALGRMDMASHALEMDGNHLLAADMREARDAVAELIEAAAFLSAELLKKYGGTAAVGEARVRVALARIGSQS